MYLGKTAMGAPLVNNDALDDFSLDDLRELRELIDGMN